MVGKDSIQGFIVLPRRGLNIKECIVRQRRRIELDLFFNLLIKIIKQIRVREMISIYLLLIILII